MIARDKGEQLCERPILNIYAMRILQIVLCRIQHRIVGITLIIPVISFIGILLTSVPLHPGIPGVPGNPGDPGCPGTPFTPGNPGWPVLP